MSPSQVTQFLYNLRQAYRELEVIHLMHFVFFYLFFAYSKQIYITDK